MIFQSFHFLLFYLIVLGTLVLFIRSNGQKKNVLLICSYYFYMSWDWRFGALLFLLTAASFLLGQRIAAATLSRRKTLYLALSVAITLGTLAYFKYVNFFLDSFNDLIRSSGFTAEIPLLEIVLPVGISFYSFQCISYAVDIYRNKVRPATSFRDFALFIAFFPQLLAGPINRAAFFLPQLESETRIDSRAVEAGIALIIRGMIKKIAFADTIALHFVDPAFARPGDFSPLFLILAAYAYSFQIYMDFSGYTDIARGIAKTFGYELPINFDRPYMATSISNFWQRWHISMSSFFRDYLFIGLGGSRYGNVYVNLLITFVAIGIWHGADWSFVAYGLTHGTIVAWERWRRTRRQRAGLDPVAYDGWRLYRQIFLIFSIVSLTRILFRGGSLQQAGEYFAAMTDFSNWNTPISAVGMAALLLAAVLHYTPPRWSEGWNRLYSAVSAPVQSAVIVTVTYVLMVLGSGEPSFVYFKF